MQQREGKMKWEGVKKNPLTFLWRLGGAGGGSRFVHGLGCVDLDQRLKALKTFCSPDAFCPSLLQSPFSSLPSLVIFTRYGRG